MPWPFDWTQQDPGLTQLASFMSKLQQSTGNQNYSPIPAPQSQVPQGFYGNPPPPTPNPLRLQPSPFQGAGASGSWGGATGGWGGSFAPSAQANLGQIGQLLGSLATPGGAAAPLGAQGGMQMFPPAQGGAQGGVGQAASTMANLARQFGAAGVPGGAMVGPGAQMGQMAFPGAQGGAGGVPSPAAAAVANLPPVQPPRGILGQSPGAAPYGIGPQGTGAPPPLPQQKPEAAPPLPEVNPNRVPPVPQRKPKPRPKAKKQSQGDQAQYTSKRRGTEWTPGEQGAPLGGQFSAGFGYEPYRRPVRRGR